MFYFEIENDVLQPLQYLQKNVGYEVDFLPTDKHKRFLQVDNITLGLGSQACPKYPKFAIFLQYTKEKVKDIPYPIIYSACPPLMCHTQMKLIFCLQMNIKSFLRLIL